MKTLLKSMPNSKLVKKVQKKVQYIVVHMLTYILPVVYGCVSRHSAIYLVDMLGLSCDVLK